jgi:putative peptide zinc metalloprotease protein
MTPLTTPPPPARRDDLVIRPIGEAGRFVVKDPASVEYFQIGEEEHFLLLQLDGERDAAAICAAFEKQFGDPLSADDLDGFIDMAREQRLLQGAELSAANDPQPAVPRPKPKQSLLYWRKSIFDPDRFFNWLEPKIRFCWTRGFLLVSAGCILLATLVLWSSRADAVSSFHHALRWETLVLAWLMMFAVGMLHEFAHGLTCKHHGGEVREIGFLLMFFMPCFYCNVSDAWLFREKSKRLWVTLAGGYFELFLWALAVFVWRITLPGTTVNYLAFLVLSLSGIDSFFNFNPLIKLDGYYLLSDALEIPNLRQRSFEYMKGCLRWLLWGAPRPDRTERSRVLLGFGLASFTYSLMFLTLMLVALGGYLSNFIGPLGYAAIGLLGVMTMRGMFQGVFQGEVKMMLLKRHRRTAMWLTAFAALAAALYFVEIEDRVTGSFQVRSSLRIELRAPAAGFLKEIHFDQGDYVSPNLPVVRLEIPDLESRLTRKQAEVDEAQAKLRLLQTGTRAEVIDDQRHRVARAVTWRDLAEKDLRRMRAVLDAQLARADQEIAKRRAEYAAAETKLARAKDLAVTNVVTAEHLQQAQSEHDVAVAQLEQGKAEKRVIATNGTREAEMELARREQDLAEAAAALTLLEAGTRTEEIEAEAAKLHRLNEELAYFKELTRKLEVFSPAHGLITTAHLKEKLGQYVEEGELICLIEEPTVLVADITLSEQDAARIKPEQAVELKARALPFETFQTQVAQVAPAAEPGELQSTVNIVCRLDDRRQQLKPGMTGHARIYTSRRRRAQIAADHILRYVRTEFWW